MRKKGLIAIATVLSIIAVLETGSFAASGHETIDELYGNVLKNGMFENGVDNWEAPQGTSINKEIINTYNNSAGAAHITQNTDVYVSTDLEVRNNQYYHASAYVKLNTDINNVTANIIIKPENGATISIGEDVLVNVNEWTLIEGDFCNKVSDISAPLRKDVYVPAKCYIAFSSVKDDIDFYLDDIIITKYEVNPNPNFQDSDTSRGWSNWSESFSKVNIDKSEVSDLIENYGFPDVSSALKIPKNYSNQCNSPRAIVPVDIGYEYIVSAWYKILDEQEGGTVILWSYPQYEVTNSANMTTLRKTPAKADGKWHHIEVTFSAPDTGENFAGDVAVNLALFCEGESVYSGNYGTDREFLLAELKIAKKSDLMKRSSLIYASTINPASNDNPDISAAYDNTLSAWSGDYVNGELLMNEKTDDTDIYDNSGVIGKFGLNGGATMIGQTVNVKTGKSYDIDVMVMPSENIEGNISGNIQIKAGSGRAANLSNMALEKGKWNKISVRNRVISASSATISLRITGGTTGDVYFGGFKVVEAEEETESPTVNSVEIADYTAVLMGNIPVVDVTSNSDYSMKYFYSCANRETDAWTVVQTGHTAVNEKIPPLFAELDMAGKYIKLTVIPVNKNLQYGESAESNIVMVRNIIKIENINYTMPEAHIKKTEISVKNTSDVKKAVIMITAFYNSSDELVALGADNQVLDIDEERVFNTTVDLGGISDNVTEKAYICEGAKNNFDSLLLCPITEVITD